MAATRAVVFTHLPVPLPDKEIGTLGAKAAAELTSRVMPLFRSLLRCRNVGLVYVYVDTGLRIMLRHLSPRRRLSFRIQDLVYEQNTRDCLRLAVDAAMRDLARSGDPRFVAAGAPKFQFVGLPHLYTLLHSLHESDPQMLRDLAGPRHQFTYDAPKFVEAVIRLVRGGDGEHAAHPIFRVDEDVEATEEGISVLLQAVADMVGDPNKYSLFSGGYGTPGAPTDPVDDFAVRLHWLVDAKTRRLDEGGRAFLRDLGGIGATQLRAPEERPFTPVLQRILSEEPQARPSPQAISGAGLYMSRLAIQALPPFMSAGSLTTWIDDHLKRRLHEVLDHIAPTAPERVDGALFAQKRHPKGITPRDIEWARTHYLERLVKGCVMHALITSPAGQPAVLAEEVGFALRPGWEETRLPKFRQRLHVASKRALANVLTLWEEADYGSPILSEWVSENRPRGGKLVDDIVDDAVAYVRLVSRWSTYVRVIERLRPIDAYWLFRFVDESPPAARKAGRRSR